MADALKTINEYFTATSQQHTDKRGLSGDSTTGVSPPQKKGTTDDDDDDVFTPPADAPAWAAMLIKSMKKISLRMDTLSTKFDSYKSHFDEQISSLRSDTQARLADLTASVEFVSTAYDKQLMINDEMSERMDVYEHRLDQLRTKCWGYENEIDGLEQYGRRNCLLFHGIPEEDGENTDETFINQVSEHLGVVLQPTDLDRSHRLGKPKEDGKARPIIAKFARHNTKSAVFREKKKLKGKNLLVTESLTRRRVTVLAESKSKYGTKNVWTMDGEIYTKIGGKKVRIEIGS